MKYSPNSSKIPRPTKSPIPRNPTPSSSPLTASRTTEHPPAHSSANPRNYSPPLSASRALGRPRVGVVRDFARRARTHGLRKGLGGREAVRGRGRAAITVIKRAPLRPITAGVRTPAPPPALGPGPCRKRPARMSTHAAGRIVIMPGTRTRTTKGGWQRPSRARRARAAPL